MRRAEGNMVVTHDRVREFSRRAEISARGLKRPLLIEFQPRDRVCHHLKTRLHLPHRGPEPVKRLPIHVLAVCVRRVLHRAEDRNPGGLEVRRLPLDVLESPGVFLLRALVLAVCLGLSIMLGAAAPESDADEVPPFRFTGRMGQGVCDTLWVWAHHLDEARQDVLTEQSLQAARRAEPAPSADDDRTPNAASSLICFLGEEVPYRQGEPADITAPDGYASTWVGTGCVSDNANTYFIGHNPGVFERVMDLEIGDKITVFDDDGASRTYYVFDTLFLPNGSNYFVYEGRIAPTGETITLQTCTGDNQRVRCVMAR